MDTTFESRLKGMYNTKKTKKKKTKKKTKSSREVSLSLSSSVLPHCAQAAIAYVTWHARQYINVVFGGIRLDKSTFRSTKASCKGFSKEDIVKVASFLAKEAPIVVHFQPEKALQGLRDDGVYRNLFETGTSNGNTNQEARNSWESATFASAYDSAWPKDRPKYGALNTMNDPRGVFSCSFTYGRAYLKLKTTSEIRSRVTISDRDTSQPNSCCVPCDWRYIILLLLKMHEMDLNQVLEVGLGKREHGSSYFYRQFCQEYEVQYFGYNEVQIHGPLRLAEDVECIVVDEEYRKDPICCQRLEDIKKRYGVPYQWQSFAFTEEEKLYSTVTQYLHLIRLMSAFEILWNESWSNFDQFVYDTI